MKFRWILYLSSKFQIQNIFGYFSGFFEIFWCEVSILHTDFCTCLHFPYLLSYFRNIISTVSYFYDIPWKVRIFHQKFRFKIQIEYFFTNFWISAILFPFLLKLGFRFVCHTCLSPTHPDQSRLLSDCTHLYNYDPWE